MSGLLDDMLGRHEYPPAVNEVVAEAAVLTALIGQLVNLGWKFSLQFRSDGPLRLVAADYFAPESSGKAARLRAYASYREQELEASSRKLISCGRDGYLAFLVDRGDGSEPYAGLTEIAGSSLSECAEFHFLKSEQIPTRIAVASRLTGRNGNQSWTAGGMMIQRLPDASGQDVNGNGATGLEAEPESEEAWARVGALFATVTPEELLGPDPEIVGLIVRLFHEEKPLASDWQPLGFGCTCSEDRVRQSLSIYSAKDIASMVNKDKVVTADCQFCGAHYELDPKELGFEAASR